MNLDDTTSEHCVLVERSNREVFYNFDSTSLSYNTLQEEVVDWLLQNVGGYCEILQLNYKQELCQRCWGLYKNHQTIEMWFTDVADAIHFKMRWL